MRVLAKARTPIAWMWSVQRIPPMERIVSPDVMPAFAARPSGTTVATLTPGPSCDHSVTEERASGWGARGRRMTYPGQASIYLDRVVVAQRDADRRAVSLALGLHVQLGRLAQL